MSDWVHLARRFVGSLRPGGPSTGGDRWAEAQLGDGEVGLWRRMSGPDRRHAIGVARATIESLGASADRSIVAAALLHDIGKIESALGPWRRAAATLVGKARGRERGRGRFGAYLRHDVIGADLLARAGSDPLTATWALEHHRPPSRWTVDAVVGAALKAADDD